ncbi:MAG: hypothetical protein IH600_07975 [Bacteroidetes bacterium]|nr:hypothetical protein [Bacteroidota bacterium]
MRRVLPLLLLLIVCILPLRAQDDSVRVKLREDYVAPPLGAKDSLSIMIRRQPASADDSMRITLKDGMGAPVVEEPETRSGLGAVLRSAVIPGWGQLYNRSYLKVPVVMGLTGFLVWGIVTEHNTFKKYEGWYAETITDEKPNGDLLYKRYREFYRDRRDTYGWWLLVTYLLQLADAYVDAALFNFDVSDESGIMLMPNPNGLGMQFRF